MALGSDYRNDRPGLPWQERPPVVLSQRLDAIACVRVHGLVRAKPEIVVLYQDNSESQY